MTAGLADGFGLLDATLLGVSALAGWVVDEVDVHAAAGAEDLPVPVVGDRAERPVVDNVDE